MGAIAMKYWSKGLGRRALDIDWSRGATEISIQDGQQLLASVIPVHHLRGELPPGGVQVVVAGNTRPPIVWRYISVLATGDFENILKLVTSPGMVNFLGRSPKGRTLFLKLTGFLVVFTLRYLWAWVRERLCRPGEYARSQTGARGTMQA